MAYIELCGGVHIAQRQRPMQISIGLGIGLDLSVGQCDTKSIEVQI